MVFANKNETKVKKKAGSVNRTGVVFRNEITKYVRGKQIWIFAALMAAFIALITLLTWVFDDGFSSNAAEFASPYISMMTILVPLAAVFFGASVIVSEYENRTALLTFTKPVSRTSVFAGKLLAASAVCVLFMIVYYGAVCAMSLLVTGDLMPGLVESLLLCIMFTLGCCGVAVLMSSITKKVGTSMLLTLMLLLLLIPMVTTLLPESAPSWLMLYSGGEMALNVITDPVPTDEIIRELAVMAAWFVGASGAAYAVFRRREF